MDNLTHSLVGLATAELALKLAERNPRLDLKKLRTPALLLSAAANNFPDLDFVYSWITEGSLGYLLHHRGHTHTFIFALPGAALLLALTAFFFHARKRPLTRTEEWFLGGLTLFGFFAHIGMDALNNYGVHPLWPFSNQWFYGDTLFIIEPWLWLALLPIVVTGAYSLWLKGIAALAWAVGLGLVWKSGYVPWPQASVLTASAAFSAALFYRRKLSATRALIAGTVVSLLTIGAFATVSWRARTLILEALNTNFPSRVTHELAITPFPANPLCLSFVAAQSDDAKDTYTAQRGTFAPLPQLWPVSHCPQVRGGFAAVNTSLAWGVSHEAPLSRLRHLARSDCRVHAYLRFSRIPFMNETENILELGDARFDLIGRQGFTTQLWSPRQLASDSCPEWVPSWKPPRSELFLATPEPIH